VLRIGLVAPIESHSESHAQGGWYRIPDSRRTVSSVSGEFRNAYQETHETQETGSIRAPIRAPGKASSAATFDGAITGLDGSGALDSCRARYFTLFRQLQRQIRAREVAAICRAPTISGPAFVDRVHQVCLLLGHVGGLEGLAEGSEPLDCALPG
jgi:hypothetical protein